VTEFRTLQYVVDTYNCTDAAKRFLSARINPEQAVEPIPEPMHEPVVERPLPNVPTPALRQTPSRPYGGYLESHDYLGRRKRIPAAPAASVAAPPPKPARAGGTNHFVTSLAFIVCLSLQVISTCAWFKQQIPLKEFAIATVVNALMTSLAVQAGVWTAATKRFFAMVPSVAQFCVLGSCWTGLYAAALTMAPQAIVAYEFPSSAAPVAASHLVSECGRLWFLVSFLMACGGLRASPSKALAAFLAVYLAKPLAAMTQKFAQFDCTTNWVLLPQKTSEVVVDGCCVSLYSVLLLLLLFGIYSFLSGDPSTFVSAGSIAYGLYAVCLLAAPDRYRMEAWPGMTASDPVMEHYVVALAISMGCLSVLLHYCAKDIDSSSRGEIYAATGYVAGLALVVIMWYFQHLLGSMAVSASALNFQSNLAAGVISIVMLVLGLAAIANAATPHTKSYMRRHDAQSMLLRVIFCSCFALAFGFYKYTPCVIECFGLNPVNPQLTLWLVVGYASVGLLYAATSQLSEAVQRDVLQYSMFVPACVLVGGQFFGVDVVQGLFNSSVGVVAFQYLSGVVLVALVICTMYTRPTRMSKLPQPEPTCATCTLVLRLMYVQSIYFAAQFYFSGPPEWVLEPQSRWWCMHAVLDLSIGLIYMAVAQAEAKAQKLVLMFGLFATVASIAASNQLYGLTAHTLTIPAVNLAAALFACM